MIEREVYLNRLISRKHNGMIKVITGIRRSGKSFLLNEIFYQHLLQSGVHPDHIILFAFDNAFDLLKINEDPIKSNITRSNSQVDPKKFINWILPQLIDNDMYYILLDEVQLLDGFESVLNGFLRKNNVDVYVTGSNSKFLSKDILTEFEGRGDEVHIFPLSFSEYYSYVGGSVDLAFDNYAMFGGLPKCVLMGSDEQKTHYLISEMNNLYIRDIIKRHHLSSDAPIGEILDVIASGISTLTNPSKIAHTFASVMQKKISDATIDKYIEYMDDAFIISRAKRYDVKGRRYIGTPFKVYFEDVGLRNARLSFRQIEETHIMENIIYNELRYRGFQVDVGVVETREIDQNKKDIRVQREIDFVAVLGSKKYYIQSAYFIGDEQKYAQETYSFDKVGDSFKKIIIVGNNMKARRDEKGYVTMSVKQFLLDPNSLDF